jgi:hypothetical protein
VIQKRVSLLREDACTEYDAEDSKHTPHQSAPFVGTR